MRCRRCGGEITLEAKYCLHCGAPNEHALQHARDMQAYRAEFADTKDDVEQAVETYTGSSVRVMTAAILFVISLILFIVGAKSYEFRRMHLESQAQRNAEEYMAYMDEMLAEEDFLAFTAFCQAKRIDTYDSAFEMYEPVVQASLHYQYIYNEIMRLAFPPAYADASMKANTLESLSDSLDYFYSALDMEQYAYTQGADNETNRLALSAMQENVSLLLQTYCNLSPDTTAEFSTMSKGHRMIVLEEAIAHE